MQKDVWSVGNNDKARLIIGCEIPGRKQRAICIALKSELIPIAYIKDYKSAKKLLDKVFDKVFKEKL